MYAIAVVGAAFALIMMVHGVWVIAYAYSPLNVVRERLKTYAGRPGR